MNRKYLKIGIIILSFLCLVEALVIINFYSTVSPKIKLNNEAIEVLKQEIDTLKKVTPVEKEVIKEIIITPSPSPTPIIESTPTPTPIVEVQTEPEVEVKDDIIDEVNDIDYSNIVYLEEFELNIDITSKSNLDGSEYDEILVKYLDTRYNKSCMKLTGDFIYKYEEEYEVNGLFTLAVALECSNNGLSDEAYYLNNPFRFIEVGTSKCMYFDSIEESIRFFNKIISTYYFNDGRNNIILVGEKYSPIHSQRWANDVQAVYDKLISICNDIKNDR